MARSVDVSVGPTCMGSGTCRRAYPELFGEDAQHRAVVLVRPAEESDDLWDALDSCPVEALSAHDSDTGEQLFP